MLALQAIINGLAIGATFSLIGIPVVLIYRASKIFNFAIGGFVVWCGLLGHSLTANFGSWVAYPTLLFLCVVGSVAFYLVCMRFVSAAGEVIGVLVSLAVGFALEGLAVIRFGPDPKRMPRIVPFKSFSLVTGKLSIDTDVIGAVTVLVLLGGGIAYLLTRTQFGRKIRAISDDAVTARSLGIRVLPAMIGTYAILGVAVFAASLAIVPSQGISAFSGFSLLIGTMTGVTIGGPERVEGAIVGGLLVGMISSVGFTVFNAFWQTVVVLAILLVVLTVRPAGLFAGLRGRVVS